MTKNQIKPSTQIKPGANMLNQVQTLFMQASALHRNGQLLPAKSCYEQILKLQPKHFDALHLLGIIALQNRDFEQAVALIGRAIKVNPKIAEAYNNHANALKELNRPDAALQSYDRAIALKPDYADAYYNRGQLYKEGKQFTRALASFDKAIALNPDNLLAYINQGNVLQALQRYDDALVSYEQVIRLKPDFVEAYLNRGISLYALQRYTEALSSYERAIAIKPDYAEAYSNRGLALHALKLYAEALTSFKQAISLNPGYAEAYSNRGITLFELKQFDEALSYYDQAIVLKADYIDAYTNRAYVLVELKRFADALACYDRLIALRPEYAEAYWNKSLMLLLLGDYATGWQLYEWRWKNPKFGCFDEKFKQPLWLGEKSPAGKTILLHAEQGLGDTIQFCRYAMALEALGAKVILDIPLSLKALLSTLPGDFILVEKGATLPKFDLHCPLLSLPYAFKTLVDSIPAQTPYLFAEQQRQLSWRETLGDNSRLRVGLVWSGSTVHKNDHNRSIPLSAFSTLLELPLEFHCLQKEIRADDLETLTGFVQLQTHQEQFVDFTDTAALIAEMDLVISVDTSLAHLAGAMGKPVWILLPYLPDFRWLLDRTDSPWYPTATLFRQPEREDWQSVLAEVKGKLNAL